ncbi:MAG: biopolymer transporter ExbD [Proteobacteria bacterium]|nr:biopolymer transporter ExbD [Pseudomonadota bacterium]
MDDKPFETMNMIPFIDIMLVLLTIVLTTSSFIASGKIPINLPQASSSPRDNDKHHSIDITANGDVYLDGQPTSPPALKTQVASLAKDTPFIVRADKDVRLQRFVDVADVLKQSGFSKVAVRTELGTP